MPSFDTPVIVWVMVAILTAVIEVSIPHFGVIFASLGAAAAALTAAFGLGTAAQLVVFVVVLVASLAILRPRLVGRSDAPGVPSRSGALIGREAIVTHDIDPTVGAGRVNVGGEDWAARCATPLPTLSALRNVIGALDLDHTLTSRDTINAQLRSVLDSATQQWGIKVMRIELKNITPPEEIRLTMEKQMTAERTRRAVVTTAEGEKSSSILRAEGQKQSQIVTVEGSKQAAILAAEGQAEARLRIAQAEAQAIQVVAQAIGTAGNPAQYLIAQRYLESLTAIANDADKLVFMPYEATGVLASLGGIRELLNATAQAPAPRA